MSREREKREEQARDDGDAEILCAVRSLVRPQLQLSPILFSSGSRSVVSASLLAPLNKEYIPNEDLNCIRWIFTWLSNRFPEQVERKYY
jgi:hypothetical protein